MRFCIKYFLHIFCIFAIYDSVTPQEILKQYEN